MAPRAFAKASRGFGGCSYGVPELRGLRGAWVWFWDSSNAVHQSGIRPPGSNPPIFMIAHHFFCQKP